jgi:hypothetical protein
VVRYVKIVKLYVVPCVSPVIVQVELPPAVVEDPVPLYPRVPSDVEVGAVLPVLYLIMTPE